MVNGQQLCVGKRVTKVVRLYAALIRMVTLRDFLDWISERGEMSWSSDCWLVMLHRKYAVRTLYLCTVLAMIVGCPVDVIGHDSVGQIVRYVSLRDFLDGISVRLYFPSGFPR